MKFNSANKNLISEMDNASTMMMNNKLLGGERAETTKVMLLKKHGASPEVIAKWKTAEARGISYEAFLLGIIDELNGGSRSTIEVDDEDDDNLGGFISRRNLRHE